MKKSINRHEAPPMGELTNSLHINVNEIPDYVRAELAAATVDLIRGILRQPGGRERLDAEIRKMRLSEKDTSAGQEVDHGNEYVGP